MRSSSLTEHPHTENFTFSFINSHTESGIHKFICRTKSRLLFTQFADSIEICGHRTTADTISLLNLQPKCSGEHAIATEIRFLVDTHTENRSNGNKITRKTNAN